MPKCKVTDTTEDRIFIECDNEMETDDTIEQIEQKVLEHSWFVDKESSTEIIIKRPDPRDIPHTDQILNLIEDDITLSNPESYKQFINEWITAHSKPKNVYDACEIVRDAVEEIGKPTKEELNVILSQFPVDYHEQIRATISHL